MSLRDFSAKPDPMMEELYAIRDAIGAKMASMTLEEGIEWLERENQAALERDGYELRPHPTIPNCRQLFKKEA